jgi:ADP-heptose:LPS heptosyltransferase
MKDVSSILSSRYKVIQLGLPGENLLPNTVDMRGKLTFAELAAYLKESQFFIGQEGFIMHLARSQETRSVIIYGGRIKAWQSGYPCNENIETNPDCSPCWQNNLCDYDRTCLKEITVNDVLEAIERIEKRLPEKLETEVVVLD